MCYDCYNEKSMTQDAISGTITERSELGSEKQSVDRVLHEMEDESFLQLRGDSERFRELNRQSYLLECALLCGPCYQRAIG